MRAVVPAPRPVYLDDYHQLRVVTRKEGGEGRAVGIDVPTAFRDPGGAGLAGELIVLQLTPFPGAPLPGRVAQIVKQLAGDLSRHGSPYRLGLMAIHHLAVGVPDLLHQSWGE